MSKMYGWSIFILWIDCKKKVNLKIFVKCVYWNIFICLKASSVAFASAAKGF